jgi:hypothetical protein
MAGAFDAAAWDACQAVGTMLNWLCLSLKGVKTSELRTKAGRRRLRLFLCAGARRLWHLLDTEAGRMAIETAERFADAEADEHELSAMWSAAGGPIWVGAGREDSPRLQAMRAACYAADKDLKGILNTWVYRGRVEQGSEVLWTGPFCHLLRDLYGNPFRRVQAEPNWLKWNGGTLPKMAQAIYDQRAYDRLPLLADALEDAGCTDRAILDHCRGPGPHFRGCWVVDLLRGQA